MFGPSPSSVMQQHFEHCGQVTQLHSYLVLDEVAENENPNYASWRRSCRYRLEESGFRLHTKPPKLYQSSEKASITKTTVDIAVDILLHSDRLERVVLVSGDGDFVRLVQALQDKGIWVDIAAHKGVSRDIAKICNSLIDPLMIPGVHYSPDNTYQYIFRVVAFDSREMQIDIEYLDRSPQSLSPHDPAWVRSRIAGTKEMYMSRRFKPGNILAWTGASGLAAYHDID
ncbi:NYN domain-containing protein [Pseudomonas sp. EL_65y_Pfl2_R96]|uniref:NYN domain-containing protein n=1 Tax=Pseudomonas sp. EL_65y_Pfl2_R96 TaxID=3088699 RepID=UPI0030D881B0